MVFPYNLCFIYLFNYSFVCLILLSYYFGDIDIAMLSPKSTNQETPATAPLDDINTTKDVSMVDVSKAEGENQQPPRRKSTIILTDEIDLDRMNIDNKESDKSNEQGIKCILTDPYRT